MLHKNNRLRKQPGRTFLWNSVHCCWNSSVLYTHNLNEKRYFSGNFHLSRFAVWKTRKLWPKEAKTRSFSTPYPLLVCTGKFSVLIWTTAVNQCRFPTTSPGFTLAKMAPRMHWLAFGVIFQKTFFPVYRIKFAYLMCGFQTKTFSA